MTMVPPHIRDQIGALAAQDGPTIRELHQQQRQRDLEEQERQRQQLSRRRDYDPAPRELTMRDVADYEKASELYELRDMAREVQRQDRLKSQIENLMQRDANAYFESGWSQVYSVITGADKDTESRI